MIRKIEIKNFQSHKDTVLDLSKGVNVIVGPTDSGKTSVIRAIRWVAENRPRGTEFRSWWGGDTEVSLTITNRGQVTRRRTKSENVYVDKKGRKTTTMTAGAVEPPESSLEILQIDRESVQEQHDSPFVLSETSGAVAKRLNEVTDLSHVDRALSIAKARHTKAKNTYEWHKELKEEAAKKVEELAWVPELLEKLDALEVLEQEIEEQRKRVEELQELVSNIRSLNPEKIREDRTRAESLLTDISSLQNLGVDLREKKEELEELEELVRQIHFAKEYRERLARKHSQAKKEFEDEFPEVCPLCGGKRGGDKS